MHMCILTQQENVSENCDVTFVISIDKPESIFINDVQTYSVQNAANKRISARANFVSL